MASDAAKRIGGPVLVARQVASGVEIICGLARDTDYGPLVVVGLGGNAVEALSLTAVALAPIGFDDAVALIDQAPGICQVATRNAVITLAETLVALGRLATDHPEIEAVDINPLILSSGGAIAVDALVVVRRAHES
jgi:acetyltransferase